ncbi:hypothetical protein BJ322DRAFT_1089567 [Thelephora terrestris]|uniref:Uncharacterized protein n=1 Tax=Thelephora terrestris TaxID=56493 RepID=A0A9P6L237_9AGAM|nr:hypothetical protein BJ322DRAFT_1089567 [Thelephora terrestris]
MSGNATGGKGSKRWQHFYAALQLAIQRSAHKWTWENFTECFPVFCEEEGDRAQGVFNTLSRHMESSLTEATDKFFDDISLKQCIDDLHAAVVDAKLRKQKGEVRPDIWREDLHPRAATRARTIPLLEKERERLLADLQELEDENLRLQEEIASNVRQFDENEKKSETLLDTLDEVLQEWERLPVEDMSQWARDMIQQQSMSDKSKIC